MDTYIKLKNVTVTGTESHELNNLADLIANECDLDVRKIKEDTAQGAKDGGLTIAIAIIGLALSSIGTIIAVMTYWQSQRPKYSVSITLGNKVISIENITPEQLQMISDAELESQSKQLEILISQKQSAS